MDFITIAFVLFAVWVLWKVISGGSLTDTLKNRNDKELDDIMNLRGREGRKLKKSIQKIKTDPEHRKKLAKKYGVPTFDDDD